MANTFYNKSIRNTILAFGNIFDNITMVRYNVDGSEQERYIVPIAYESKERYVMRLEGDPDLDKKVQLTLPRMSYEMNEISYDKTRKQNTNGKNFYQSNALGVTAQYNPVPYNFDFSLHLYVRNMEDHGQILEHILSYFTPDYTLKVNMIPVTNGIKELPIILNTTKYENMYEGDSGNSTRTIIWTLNFTAKGYIFGGITNNNSLIRTTITNIYNTISEKDKVTFVMYSGGNGSYRVGEIVYQGFSINTSLASGKVVSWDPVTLKLSIINIIGNFVSSAPMIGSLTNARYNFSTYNFPTIKYAQVVGTPMATDSNANNIFVVTSTIFETPNSNAAIVVSSDFSGDLNIQTGRDDLGIEQNNILDLNN